MGMGGGGGCNSFVDSLLRFAFGFVGVARFGVRVFIPVLFGARSGLWSVLMIGVKSGRKVGLISG